jgi:hypothetical protein
MAIADPAAPVVAHFVSSLQSLSAPLPAIAGINLARFYRAHVQGAYYRSPERTAFVEAFSHQCACKKIAATVAVLENRTPAEVAYNCFSAQELVDQGLSEDPALRLFETGWSGGRPTYFVREPLFLLAAPAAMIRKWAAIPAPELAQASTKEVQR